MKQSVRMLLAGGLLALSTLANAANSMSDTEENFLRGFFDQQWLAVSYDKLALKKGSKDTVRAFAQSELDMYQSLGAKMLDINQRYGLIDISAAATTPKLGEGVTRGFTELPKGAQWAGVSVLNSIADDAKHDTNANTLVNDLAKLEKLSGEEFDQEYAVRIIMLHQRMLRHTLREMQPAGGNADVKAFAQNALAALNQQNESAENVYNGRVRPSGPPPQP